MLHAAAAGALLTATALISISLDRLPDCSDPHASWNATSLVLDYGDGSTPTVVPFAPAWTRAPTAASTAACTSNVTTTGFDAIGAYVEHAFTWATAAPTESWVTAVRVYQNRRTLRFSQRFPAGLRDSTTGDEDAVCTSFPGLRVKVASGPPLGFAHFAGYMAGNSPQYGTWAPGDASFWLSGGIQNSGVVTLFEQTGRASIVISPASSFMAASLAVRKERDGSGGTVCDWGVFGNATSIPAGFSADWIMVASPQGPSDSVRNWGATMRTLYGRQSEEESHQRDLTTSRLGYGTDNGAYYYYYTGANASHTYDDVLRDVKTYSVEEAIPYSYVELDSWWYYRQDGQDTTGVPLSGVTNWTAMPSVFPRGGLPGVFNATQWPIMAHNRYWGTNNVYASNPLVPIGPTEYHGRTFDFAWGFAAGLPTSVDFWNNLFTINSDWGLTVYLQDWLSVTTSSMPQLTSNVTFGRKWLHDMAAGAANFNLSIQYCMSFPRHVLQALELPSVTSARASNDYQPQTNVFDYDQWAIGESSLWVAAIGVVPSKDNFWSMSTPQYAPHYDPLFDTRETRNRLESVVATMSNGPVMVSDRVGFSNRTLIMMSCDASGRLLRPDTAAGPIDAYFIAKASFPALRNTATALTGRVHVTWSFPGVASSAHGYLLAVNLKQPWNLTYADLPDALRAAFRTGVVGGWLAYEANSTAALRFLGAASPLLLQASNEWSFEYFTMAPVSTDVVRAGAGWVFIGEQTKHIAASKQRFPVSYRDPVTGDVIAVVDGTAGETVKISVADFATLAVVTSECRMAAPQMKFHWSVANRNATCVPH